MLVNIWIYLSALASRSVAVHSLELRTFSFFCRSTSLLPPATLANQSTGTFGRNWLFVGKDLEVVHVGEGATILALTRCCTPLRRFVYPDRVDLLPRSCVRRLKNPSPSPSGTGLSVTQGCGIQSWWSQQLPDARWHIRRHEVCLSITGQGWHVHSLRYGPHGGPLMQGISKFRSRRRIARHVGSDPIQAPCGLPGHCGVIPRLSAWDIR